MTYKYKAGDQVVVNNNMTSVMERYGAHQGMAGTVVEIQEIFLGTKTYIVEAQGLHGTSWGDNRAAFREVCLDPATQVTGERPHEDS